MTRKRKSLGQIAYEAAWDTSLTQAEWMRCSNVLRWERAAAAVEKEVLRQWGLTDQDKEIKRRCKAKNPKH